MIKLLIVDDEPLIQVGIQSMINWQEHQIEICGTASNGENALSLIQKHSPDLVIADIKMPVMDGLTLAKICKERFGTFPLFIILTSHEDFQLIKEALKYDIIDYLIKLDLTPESLHASIQKAVKLVLEKKSLASPLSSTDYQFYYDKFFISLLHSLFQNETQFKQLSNYLHLDFSYSSYTACQCTLVSKSQEYASSEKLITLYKSTLQMLQGLLSKYLPAYIFSMGIDTFCIIFCFNHKSKTENELVHLLKEAVLTTSQMIYNYFNVHILTSAGRIVLNPMQLSESFQDARQAHSYTTIDSPIVFYSELLASQQSLPNYTFNMGLFKQALCKSFEEYDETALYETLTSIIELFKEHPAKYLQAMDAACNILYLAISLLPNGESALGEIFKCFPDGYQSIYKQTTLDELLIWMTHLRDGLCKLLTSLQKKHSHKTILHVKTYLDEHITEKLTLIDVAAAFNITPNYLSLLFKKHSSLGFTEYITQKKIAYAKTLLDEGQLKIYEVAQQLGFESAFYFSKVFKKVEGCSPRDYKQYQ